MSLRGSGVSAVAVTIFGVAALLMGMLMFAATALYLTRAFEQSSGIAEYRAGESKKLVRAYAVLDPEPSGGALINKTYLILENAWPDAIVIEYLAVVKKSGQVVGREVSIEVAPGTFVQMKPSDIDPSLQAYDGDFWMFKREVDYLVLSAGGGSYISHLEYRHNVTGVAVETSTIGSTTTVTVTATTTTTTTRTETATYVTTPTATAGTVTQTSTLCQIYTGYITAASASTRYQTVTVWETKVVSWCGTTYCPLCTSCTSTVYATITTTSTGVGFTARYTLTGYCGACDLTGGQSGAPALLLAGAWMLYGGRAQTITVTVTAGQPTTSTATYTATTTTVTSTATTTKTSTSTAPAVTTTATSYATITKTVYSGAKTAVVVTSTVVSTKTTTSTVPYGVVSVTITKTVLSGKTTATTISGYSIKCG